MTKKRMNQVFDHFNREAAVFDANVLKSIPHYKAMIAALIDMLPFPRDKKIALLDVGTGTGNIALALKQAFPNANLTCLDLAPNMLKIAQGKLAGFENVEYVEADAASYAFDRQYDAIVSSLTLHHLETDQDKSAFHKKAFKGLKPGGMFINADVMIAPDQGMQEAYLAKWKSCVIAASDKAFFEDRYQKYLAEDRPAVLLNELKSLEAAGFKAVEVFWKYYNFAVYGGLKFSG